MSRNRILLGLAALSLSLASIVHAGGWAIVTVKELPDHLVAGQGFAVTFAVRQHGMTLTNGLKPTIYAKGPGKADLKIGAQPSGRDGEYRFELKLPEPGDWRVTIDSGFISFLTGGRTGSSDVISPAAGVVTLSLTVIPSGASPVAMSEKQQGERLFTAKGCIGCHTTGIASEVTVKTLTRDYIKRVLADPAGTLKSRKDSFPEMPNLELKPTEIDSLAAFLGKL